MRKEISLAAGMILLLSGCTQVSGDLKTRIGQQMEFVSTQDAGIANRNKAYYSYYIEPSVGRYSGNETGNIFVYQGSKILMNLNVPMIINAKTYPNSTADGMEDIRDPYVEYKGSYVDFQEVKRNYHVMVYQQDANYLILMSTDTLNFYAVCDAVKVSQLTGEMLKIARSVEVHTDTLLAAYTNHKVLEYKTEKIELYNEIVPEEGDIGELINDTNTIGNGKASQSNGSDSSDASKQD